MNVVSRDCLGGRALRMALGSAGILAALLVSPSLLGTQAASGEGKTVATVNGEVVLESDLEAESKEQLDQVDLQLQQCELKASQQRYEVLEGSAERVVRRKLLELEAERLGNTPEELADDLRNSVPEITTDDVDAWWEANKERVRTPREEVEDQIRTLLARDGLQEVEEQFFVSLRERYEVEIMLEPFRLEIAHAGFPSVGPEDAPVVIVEFSDFECPYCKRVLPTIEEVTAEYPDNVRLVFRQFPLTSIHSNAQKAAEASLCARDQGKFWEMHDLMFEEQKNLTVAELKEKAGRLELDQSGFDSCLDSGRYEDVVAKDVREGAVVGVTGTPSLFVNGRKLSGAVSFETVAKVIDDELSRDGRGGSS